jgi:hypothetical protein
VAHEAGHAATAEDDQRAAEDAKRHLNGAEAQQEQPGRECVVARVVCVVHPQREQAVGRPFALMGLCGLQVLVVQPPFRVLSCQGNGVKLLGWHRAYLRIVRGEITGRCRATGASR